MVLLFVQTASPRCDQATGLDLSLNRHVFGNRTAMMMCRSESFGPESAGVTTFAYDAAGRVVSETRTGPGSPTNRVEYGYGPLAPDDLVAAADTRPRTVVRRVDGVECGRTYRLYAALTDVVERAASPGAPYGAPGGLRTVTAYYPADAADWAAGRIRSVRREDGRLDAYAYALADGVWTTTVVHLHENAAEPAEGRTTRDVARVNARNETVERRTEAFAGGAWRVVARTSFAYDAEGRVVRETDLAGRTAETGWDCCRKVSESRPDGSRTTYAYDVDGRLVAESRLAALDLANDAWVTTAYAYDGLGRVVATWTTNCEHAVGLPAATTAYDALGRVSATDDGLGGVRRTAYSPDGRTQTTTDAAGATACVERDVHGEVVSVTGTAVLPEFTARGVLADGTRWTRVARGSSPGSARFACRYENMLGQTVREERSGFGGAVLAAVHAYDAYGRLVSTASDGEPATEYVYDDLGARVATVRSADGRWRRTGARSAYVVRDGVVFLSTTNATSCSDPSIAPLAESRDVQLTGLSAAVPARAFSYDVRGNATETWTECGGDAVVSRRRAPGASNAASSTSRRGVEVETVSVSAVTNRTEYDALGRAVARIDGRGSRTTTEYDARGRRSATVDAAGGRTAYAYDALGRLAAATNALGEATVYAYDLRGRKTYEGGATYPVRYGYDVYGNRTSMTTYRDESSGVGDTTRWLYDEASGVMTNKVYADGMGPKYEYDTHGRLTKRTWARGVETLYVYDGWGNLTNTAYSDSTPSVVLCYDTMGRQIRAVDAAGVTTFAYDVFGSLTNETVVGVAGTNVLERFTDTFGRDAGYALNGVRQSTLAYDPVTGRLATMLAVGNDAPFAWNYLDGSDLKSSLSYPNGLFASWNYGNRDELLEVNNASPTGTISKYTYIYDAAGRRVSCAKSGSAFETPDMNSYLYNARSELTNATAVVDAAYRYGYLFDDIGNRESSSERGTNSAYTANDLNQYTSITNSASPRETFTPQFDADGNQTRVKTATGIWQVAYNGENRPVLGTQGTNTISMSFDRMGRRITKNDLRFVYDGYLQIADNNGSAYVWDPAEPIATRPLTWCNSALLTPPSALYYTHDGNKNVSEVVSASGETFAHYEYAPFGAITTQYGASAAANPWRFSSEYAEDDTGTVYYNYRHYDPVMGRWLTLDPLEEEGGICLYAFCSNRSVDEIDVRGGILFVPIIFAKAMAYAIAVMTAYKATACFYATQDMQPTETDAYRHCYISCAYSKCMEDFAGKYVSQVLSLIGGLFWEIVGSLQKDGSFSVEDLKSDLIGAMGSLDYSSCEEPCECERGKVNPK